MNKVCTRNFRKTKKKKRKKNYEDCILVNK